MFISTLKTNVYAKNNSFWSLTEQKNTSYMHPQTGPFQSFRGVNNNVSVLGVTNLLSQWVRYREDL